MFSKFIFFRNLGRKKKYFCIRCIFCIFTRKTMHKWRRMCKYFVIYEKAKAEDRFFKFASKVRRGAGKIGSDVLTLIKLIDHDLIWRDEKLHSSIIQDKKSVLERSESQKKLERLLTFSQNFFTMNYSSDICFKKTARCLKKYKKCLIWIFVPKKEILKKCEFWQCEFWKVWI